jgi:hypothetical protein
MHMRSAAPWGQAELKSSIFQYQEVILLFKCYLVSNILLNLFFVCVCAYVCMHACMCVCVCVRERERERESQNYECMLALWRSEDNIWKLVPFFHLYMDPQGLNLSCQWISTIILLTLRFFRAQSAPSLSFPREFQEATWYNHPEPRCWDLWFCLVSWSSYDKEQSWGLRLEIFSLPALGGGQPRARHQVIWIVVNAMPASNVASSCVFTFREGPARSGSTPRLISLWLQWNDSFYTGDFRGQQFRPQLWFFYPRMCNVKFPRNSEIARGCFCDTWGHSRWGEFCKVTGVNYFSPCYDKRAFSSSQQTGNRAKP